MRQIELREGNQILTLMLPEHNGFILVTITTEERAISFIARGINLERLLQWVEDLSCRRAELLTEHLKDIRQVITDKTQHNNDCAKKNGDRNKSSLYSVVHH